MNVTILPQTVKNPITFMGECAGIAYDSDISDNAKNYRRGRQCVADNHGRLLEFCDVFMIIQGASCRVMREFMRHVGDGLTAVQRSTRYVSESQFDCFFPQDILNDKEKKKKYAKIMNDVRTGYNELVDMGVSKEDAANVLPLGMNTTVVLKKNARCLMDMSRVRLCSRTYEEYRRLMKMIVDNLKQYSQEWEKLADELFKPNCEALGYCPEKFGCGKYPNLAK